MSQQHHDSSRRDFLKGSAGLIAGAALASTLMPRGAYAASDDTIKIALIGCGGRGSGAASQALHTKGPVKLIAVADGRAVKLGDLAQYVLDKRIPLEICLLSNVHTGAARSLAEHPFKILYQEKFRVTLNTDNRLMSDTSMTKEFEAARDAFDLSIEDFEKITINAMKSAFLPYDQRCDFIYTILKPGYAKVRSAQSAA